MIKKIFCMLLFVIELFSCTLKGGEKSSIILDSINVDNQQTINEDSLGNAALDDYEQTEYDDFQYPIDSLFTLMVLPSGTANYEESILKKADEKQWYGLFKNKKDKYYLQQTSVKITKNIDNEEDTETGEPYWMNVAIEDSDSCIILMEKNSNLTNRIVKSAKIEKACIYPNETTNIQFNGINYKLSAEGVAKDKYNIKNYKLYIEADINGQHKKSLLTAAPYFDESMVEILFAGDIDNDNILDLIIETSWKYSMGNPVLYLSHSAKPSEVVIPVGGYKIYGC